ncbi:MAG: hypothetical protein K9I94_03895 [Bacteroidales bacterium]|nr:hypothetical protein [Bacteroidales bacterium]
MEEGMVIPIAFFAMIFGIVYLNVRKKERQMLIERGLDATVFDRKSSGNGSLKWGLLLVGVGLGIIAGNILVANYVMSEEAAYFSMIFLLGGIALLISHFIDRKHKLEDREEQMQQGSEE